MAERRIEIESGEWDWRITEPESSQSPYVSGLVHPTGDADPDSTTDPETAEADPVVLLLEDPENPDHWMSSVLSVEDAEGDLSQDDVLDRARTPDVRQRPGRDGRIWRAVRIEKPEAVVENAEFERSAEHVRVSREGAPERVVPLPGDRPLGTLSRDELLELFEGGE